jgi:hypothetical protein
MRSAPGRAHLREPGDCENPLSTELRDGRLDLRYRIDVEDTDGRAVFSLPRGNAFETIRAYCDARQRPLSCKRGPNADARPLPSRPDRQQVDLPT